jgi:hypothetical protein
MKRTSLSLALFGLLGLLATGATAQTVSPAPALMNFSGRLARPDGTPVPDGTYSVRFSLWNVASGGTPATNEKWNQTLNVTVRSGVFAALLNTSTGAADKFNGNLWLEMKIGSAPPLTPRQQLTSVAYAMKANSVPDGSITANSLASGTLNSLSWLLTGNNISNPATQFLGTTSNQPLVFRTNNTEKMRLLANGNLGLGTNNPGRLLQLGDAGVSGSTGLLRLSSRSNAGDAARSWDIGVPMTGETLTGSGYSFVIHDAGSGANIATNPTFLIQFGTGNVGLGTTAPTQRLDVRNGNIALTNASGSPRALLAYNSPLDTGYLQLFNGSNNLIAGLGGGANGGEIFLRDAAGANSIVLSGSTGEMTAKIVTVTGGSDVAEPYHVAPAGGTEPIPGMVVCIDGDKIGQMKVAARAYDKTVSGILSGANGIRPGITLTQKGTIADGELPVASIGRVWCWCDAEANGAIEAGDMLTTSDTPGHAMKVNDHSKANGAVIGKAMSNLKSGKGLVLVLVSLK